MFVDFLTIFAERRFRHLLPDIKDPLSIDACHARFSNLLGKDDTKMPAGSYICRSNRCATYRGTSSSY